MDLEKLEKITLKNKLLESDNSLLVNKLKEKNKELKQIENLYSKEVSKINLIKDTIQTKSINSDNYLNFIECLKKVLDVR